MDKQTEREKSPLLALLANLQQRQLTPREQQQIRQALGRYFEGDILFYQPKLWPKLQQADWATWLQELMKFLETYDLLAEDVLNLNFEQVQPQQALVPDKITLDQLLAGLKEAEQQQVEIDRWVARMMQQAGLDRPTVEAILQATLEEARLAPAVPSGGAKPSPAEPKRKAPILPTGQKPTPPPVLAAFLQALPEVLPEFGQETKGKELPTAKPLVAAEAKLRDQIKAQLNLRLAAAEISLALPVSQPVTPPLRPPRAGPPALRQKGKKPVLSRQVGPQKIPSQLVATPPTGWLGQVLEQFSPSLRILLTSPGRVPLVSAPTTEILSPEVEQSRGQKPVGLAEEKEMVGEQQKKKPKVLASQLNWQQQVRRWQGILSEHGESPVGKQTAERAGRLALARNYLRQWQQLPAVSQEQGLVAFHHQFWRRAVDRAFPETVTIEREKLTRVLTIVHLPLASPRWQEAAQETVINWYQWSLAKPWRKFFASQQLPAQISLAQAGQTIVSGLKENPALLRATLATSPDQSGLEPGSASGLGHFYRALSFFRPPHLNQSLGKITPQTVPPLTRPFVSWQQKITRHQSWTYRFYWRLAGGHDRWWQPSLEKGGGFLQASFSSLRRQISNWLLRRGLGWAEKQLAKTGLKIALKKGLVKLATILGLGSGPPGWVVTVAIWAKDILGKINGWLGRLVFGRGGLGRFLASFGGLIQLPAGENPSFKKMVLIVGGSLLVVVLLLPILVIITIAGALYTSSERGQASAAYFNLLYKDRVACQAEAQSPIARQACLIENAFQQCQGGSEVPVVTENNFGQMVPCLQENGVDAAAIDALHQGFYENKLQCVGFAKAAVPWLRTVRVAAARDLLNYFDQKSWQDLQPGDVVVSDAGKYGHVAVVTAVLHPEVGETMVQISQADGYKGAVFTSRLPLNYFTQSGHWYPIAP